MCAERQARRTGANFALLAAVSGLLGCGARPAAPPQVASAPAAPAVSVANAAAPGCVPAGPAGPAGPVIAFGSSALVEVCRDLYVDPATTPAERGPLVHAVEASWATVGTDFGGTTSPPPITIFCKSAACVDALGGPAGRAHVVRPGQSFPGSPFVSKDRSVIVTFASGPGPGQFLVHEMVHVEMLHRLGPVSVPEWFSEGLAFSLAGQRDKCAGVPPAIDDLRRLAHNWVAFNDRHGSKATVAAYCQAGAELDAWLAREGKNGMLDLLARVARGKPFEETYGPLLTTSASAGANVADDEADDDSWVANAHVDVITLSGEPDSFVETALIGRLSDPDAAFTLALWVKPTRSRGTLVHVSSSAQGGGWCTPFLGFDGEGRLVAEVLHEGRASPPRYAVASAPVPLPIGRWAHVAMTWAPGAPTRLYVDGVEAGHADPATYQAAGAGLPLFVTWGSPGVQGRACFAGAIRSGAFAGSIRAMKTFGKELTAAEIAALVKKTAPSPP